MDNPYVGPSPFSKEYKDYFFGREDDVRDIKSLLRTERIVVLHSPSGAGKTSLIQAGLIPELQSDAKANNINSDSNGENIHIINPIRLGFEPPEGAVSNRFTYSTLLTIETALFYREVEEVRSKSTSFSKIPLDHYFFNRSGVLRKDIPTLLVFDQFEDIFTLDPDAHEERVEFFNQLSDILQDRNVWALIAMREEYVAALDQYKRQLPTQLNTRYHLNLLTGGNARDAIELPAKKLNVKYDTAAIFDLIKDLSDKKVSNGNAEEETVVSTKISNIDPLHLQLICEHLWQTTEPVSGQTLTSKDISNVFPKRTENQENNLTPVEQSLLFYYEKNISKVAIECSVDEYKLRSWIDDKLIDQDRYRRIGNIPQADDDLNKASKSLEDLHILRPVLRIDQTWFEISHDRLVVPIRQSNDLWYSKTKDLLEFQKQARIWCKSGRHPNYPIPKKHDINEYKKKLDKVNKQTSQTNQCENQFLEYCETGIKNRRLVKTGFIAASFAVLLAVFGLSIAIQNSKEHRLLTEETKKIRKEVENREEKLNHLINDISTANEDLVNVYDDLKIANEHIIELSESGQKRITASKWRNNVNVISRQSITQRWQTSNHDTATLLARLAGTLLDYTYIKGPDLNISPLRIKSTLWTVAQTSPFSQSLSRDYLNGYYPNNINTGEDLARIVMGHSEDVSAVLDIQVPTKKGWPEIDYKLKNHKTCGLGDIISANGDYIIGKKRKTLYVHQIHNCALVTRESIPYKIFKMGKVAWRDDSKKLLITGMVKKDKSSPYKAKLINLDSQVESGWIDLRKEEVGHLKQPSSVSVNMLDANPRNSVLLFGYSDGYLEYCYFSSTENSCIDQKLIKLWSDPKNKPNVIFSRIINKDSNLLREIKNNYNDLFSMNSVSTHEEVEHKNSDNIKPKNSWVLAVLGGSWLLNDGKIVVINLSNQNKIIELRPNEVSLALQESLINLGRERNGGKASFTSASLSNNGDWLVVATSRGTIHRWDLNSAKIEISDSAFKDIAPLMDSSGLQTYVDKNKFPITANQKVLSGMRGGADSLYVSDDGNHIVSGSRSEGIRIWMVSRERFNQQINTTDKFNFKSNASRISDIRFDELNNLVLSNYKRGVAFANIKKDIQEELELNIKNVGSKATKTTVRSVDIKNNIIALGLNGGILKLIDISKKKRRHINKSGSTHSDGLWSVRFSELLNENNEKLLATASYHLDGLTKGQVFLWKVIETNNSIFTEKIGEIMPNSRRKGKTLLEFDGSGCKLAVSQGFDIYVYLLNINGCSEHSDDSTEVFKLESKIPLDFEIRSLAFSNDGFNLAAGGASGALKYIELKKPSDYTIRDLKGVSGDITGLQFLLPEKNRENTENTVSHSPLLVSTGLDGYIRLWDPKNKNELPLKINATGKELHAVRVSNDNKWLVTADSDENIIIYDFDLDESICKMVIRDFTKDEILRYIGEIDYKLDGVCKYNPTDDIPWLQKRTDI